MSIYKTYQHIFLINMSFKFHPIFSELILNTIKIILDAIQIIKSVNVG